MLKQRKLPLLRKKEVYASYYLFINFDDIIIIY